MNNPCEYESSIGIGQDGSCNGLQHYAAMLRDTKMAENVNVASREKRGDIYSVVKDYVSELIEVDNKISDKENIKNMSKKINGKITRKMVKQTVMTSVYGVTDYGANAQVRKWLTEAVNKGDINGFDNNNEQGVNEIFKVANYIAKHTVNAIGKANTPAYLTMLWLKDCAYKIASNGHFVSWKTPLNLPCTQHYAHDKVTNIQGSKQNITLLEKHGNNNKTNRFKQSNSFPPNFVHSLDSTHCLMTANECYNRINNNNNNKPYKITFASIHDSFWTHADDVDIMNIIIRDTFIQLHNQPLLQNLYKKFNLLHPSIDFIPPPNISNFDLNEVKKSEFFFS